MLPNPNPSGAATSDMMAISFQESTMYAVQSIDDNIKGLRKLFASVLKVNTENLNLDKKQETTEKINLARERATAAEEKRESKFGVLGKAANAVKEKTSSLVNKVTGSDLFSGALQMAAIGLVITYFDEIKEFFVTKLIPAFEKLYEEGLKPLYENLISPMLDWFMDTAFPTFGDAFFQGLDNLTDLFSGLAEAGKLISEGEYAEAAKKGALVIGQFILDSIDGVLTYTLKLFGVDLQGKSVFEIIKNWFKENIYDSETGKIFGSDLPEKLLSFDGFSYISDKISGWFKENVYDSETGKIFGYAIPEKLFEFNMFQFIKQSVDDVISSIEKIFDGDFSTENLLEGGKAFFDLVYTPFNLAINFIKDIFKWGDPEEPFRLSEFIISKIMSVKSFFTNEEGTGIFDFTKPGEEFSIMGVVNNFMKKVIDFLDNIFDIDFDAIAEKILPDNFIGDAVREKLGIMSPEQKERKKADLKTDIKDLEEELGSGNYFFESSRKDDEEKLKKLQEELKALEDTSPLGGQGNDKLLESQTNESAVVMERSYKLGSASMNATEAAVASSLNATKPPAPIVIASPSTSSPTSVDQSQTIINNSNRQTTISGGISQYTQSPTRSAASRFSVAFT